MSQVETPLTESADGEVNFETTLREAGQAATVVKDDKGKLVYPGYVPQSTQSPTMPETLHDELPPLPAQGPRKAVTQPLAEKDDNDLIKTRPQMGHKSVTDTPRKIRRRYSALPPQMKRVGTNTSQLQQALWTSTYDQDDSSSTDSSEDDDGPDFGIEQNDQAVGAAPPQRQYSLGDQLRRFRVGNKNYKTKGKVSKRDGRLAISVKDLSHTGYLTKALGAAISKVSPLKEGEISGKAGKERPTFERASSETIVSPETFRCPPLNIVIMVIGSRGDVQPFLKIGKILKEQYGHRVRIATHPAFRDFVEKDSDLEFFSVGGDPSELMAFMVKNPGLIPTLETLRAGDIGKRRAAMAEMFGGFWRACVNATDDEKDTRNLKLMGDKQPFIADLIIANPASFAHVHCAEALGIPLILSFTFPYTPTKSFPHPLASIKASNVDLGYTNFMSYPMVEMMIWQGLGDLVNDLRVKTLGLDPVSTLWAPGALYRMNVPFAYLWSPSLVPKPADWGDEVDVCGFVYLDLAASFIPPDPLQKFLDAGEAPIYIGFGSIVVDDANKFTRMIFEAVKLAGVRALVSKGWGGLGGDSLDVPENIFLLDNTPHDWLFPRVKACVIHGGAGTTAIAIKCGKPIMIVPFFGDQFFWGTMIEKAKAGPEPVPYKRLSAEKIAEGIKFCLTKEAQMHAESIANDIKREGDGAENMCAFVHQHLTLAGKRSMRCSILDDRVAVWHLKGTSLRLSALAADILVEKGWIHWRKLRLIRHCEWNDFEGPPGPVTGVLGSVAGTFGDVFSGIGGVPSRLAKSSKTRRERKEAHRSKVDKEKSSAETKDSGNGAAIATGRDSKIAVTNLSLPQDASQGDKAEGPSTEGPIAPNHGANETGDPDEASLDTAATDASAAEPWYVNEVSRGALKSAGALASAPIDLSIALAQGFHNAPRLYGDDTVRRPQRVTGIQSGLRAARQEFVYGLYDAWTGVVRLPARGAKQGVRGFTKGVGMGLSGLVLKDVAAFIGPVGYTLQGVKKQVERSRRPYKHIRRARILQGQREMAELSDDKREQHVEQVEKGWEVMRSLWETVERKEKEKGGLRAQFSARKKRGVGQAYDSVEMASAALEEVTRGGKLTVALKEYRKSEELARMSQDRRSMDRGSMDRRSMDRRSVDKRRSQDGAKGSTNKLKRADMSEPIAEDDESGARKASVAVGNGET
ncbi:hypothetical protein N0V93_005090 [Gnomoniopsis smithogilvyi]|uniref:Glycosyltransferase family 28 N-terminal domain-containing protein n=1 Tax=Gnomoniopsis smithogilvyi TaxID=1191159 RepID=A0A9W9CWT2_9PEZI|nr:hypothetical protein N0V93_005090 [Gnomoniopsis smithogilvyi]